MVCTDGALLMEARAAVLGSPIAHSISPDLHQAAYAALGLEGWAYQRIEQDAASFPAWFAGLDTRVWRGLSLTTPLKETAVPLMTRLSPSAEATGAVNTITWTHDGTDGTDGGDSAGGDARHPGLPIGDNTDVHGIVQAFRAAGLEQVDTACVLGAGATARSAVLALSQLGAERITLMARSRERAETARDLASSLGITAAYVPLRRLDLLGGADAIVSALPWGAADDLAHSLRDGGVDSDPFAGAAGVLLDVVYQSWPTALASAWDAAGGRIVSGFEMLLHQAAQQVQLMTGLEAPLDAMRAAGEAALRAAASPV